MRTKRRDTSAWPVEKLSAFAVDASDQNRRKDLVQSRHTMRRLTAGLYAAVVAVSLAAMFAFIGIKPVMYLATKGKNFQQLLPEMQNLIESCDSSYPGCFKTFKYPKSHSLDTIHAVAKNYNLSPRVLTALEIATGKDLEYIARTYSSVQHNNRDLTIPPTFTNRYGTYKTAHLSPENYHLLLVFNHLVSDKHTFTRLLLPAGDELPDFVRILNQLKP